MSGEILQSLVDHGQYFCVTGLSASPKGTVLSREMARVAGKLTHSVFARLATGDRLSPTYYNLDENQGNHLDYSEILSNCINSDLLNKKECRDASAKVDRSLDHGYNHIRRIEKWYKAFYENDKTLRLDHSSMYFAPSSYLSMRLHDFVEVATGKKDRHEVAGALFALAYLSSISTDVLGATGIPYENWEKLVWGTAFICYHHSKPEKTLEEVTPKSLLASGFFNINTIFDEVAGVAQKAGKKDIYEYFPPFELVRSQLEGIRSGKLFTHNPWYTKDEIDKFFESETSKPEADKVDIFIADELLELKGLIRQTYLLSAADKLDSNYPKDLSSSRTVMAASKRVFYLPISEPGLNIAQEFEERKELGNSDDSKCDLNRLLFEISRTGIYDEVSHWLSFIYSDLLRDKGEFIYEAIEAFLNGDFTPYLAVYERLERESVREFLRKAGVPLYAEIASRVYTKGKMIDLARRALIDRGFEVDLFNLLLSEVGRERSNVAEALENKFRGLQELGINAELKDHILKLVKYAIGVQKQKLSRLHGSLDSIPPYPTYYAISLKRQGGK